MIIIKITDESCVGAARRTALHFAQQLNFKEKESGKLAIIVTELASNLIKYAGPTGELLIQSIQDGQKNGIQILSLDKGPGIANVAQCLQDGYSTQQTAGTGLGAISRLATVMSIYSLPGKGTLVFTQLEVDPPLSLKGGHYETGAIHVPITGEEVCGDAWVVEPVANNLLCMVADGLGHGPEAALASERACQTLSDNKELSLVALLDKINKALYKTRGAAIAIAKIEPEQKAVRFIGVGNISAQLVLKQKSHHLASRDGIVGLYARPGQEILYAWEPDALLIMHSDGLMSRWSLNDYPALAGRPSTLIAGILYRDFNRNNDDATVLVARQHNAA
jgi:anti-sigma regulatory factor (Ser/Thr protein kinase)